MIISILYTAHIFTMNTISAKPSALWVDPQRMGCRVHYNRSVCVSVVYQARPYLVLVLAWEEGSSKVPVWLNLSWLIIYLSRFLAGIYAWANTSNQCLPYLLDQTLWLLFITSPEFVQRLLIPVAAREAILRETVNWYHWSRPLCWCRRRLKLVLDCLSCTCTCYQE